MQRTIFFTAALMIALGGAPADASAQGAGQAQTPDAAATNRARELFHEGVELTNRGSYPEAIARFREALGLRRAPAIAYNLAAALAETGEFVEAGELVEEVLADETTPRAVRGAANELSASLEGRYAQLTVYVLGDRGDAMIQIDDRPLDETHFGAAIRLNPGTHTVIARRGGSVLETEERTMAEGQSATVSLDPSSWSILDPELSHGAAEEDDTGSSPIYAKWWFWTAIGAVVVGGVVIGVAASSGSAEPPLQGNTSPAVITFP